MALSGCNSEGVDQPTDLSMVSNSDAADLALAEQDLSSGATCDDRVINQDESDVDCGGALCPKCGSGRVCRGDDDCVSVLCQGGACLDGPSCVDGRKDGNETDTDCGGPDCKPCQIGAACRRFNDCTTHSCKAGVCSTPAPLQLAFDNPVQVPLDNRFSNIAMAADFNGDGRADLATVEPNGKLHYLQGKGDGTFLKDALGQSGGSSAQAATVVDFDRDGKVDIATIDGSVGDFCFAQGAAQQAFLVATVIRYMKTPLFALVAGDFDGDGASDVATDRLIGYGDGKWGLAVVPGRTSESGVLLAVDLNGDGRTDLLGPDGAWLAEKGRTFVRSWTNADWPGRSNQLLVPQYQGVDTPDLDGDLQPDLVFTLRGSLVGFRGDGKGGFLKLGPWTAPMGPGALAAADFDGDGWPDVLLAEEMASTLRFYRGLGNGTLKDPIDVTPKNLVGVIRSIAVADFNRDGKADLGAVIENGNMGTYLASIINVSK